MKFNHYENTVLNTNFAHTQRHPTTINLGDSSFVFWASEKVDYNPRPVEVKFSRIDNQGNFTSEAVAFSSAYYEVPELKFGWDTTHGKLYVGIETNIDQKSYQIVEIDEHSTDFTNIGYLTPPPNQVIREFLPSNGSFIVLYDEQVDGLYKNLSIKFNALPTSFTSSETDEYDGILISDDGNARILHRGLNQLSDGNYIAYWIWDYASGISGAKYAILNENGVIGINDIDLNTPDPSFYSITEGIKFAELSSGNYLFYTGGTINIINKYTGSTVSEIDFFTPDEILWDPQIVELKNGNLLISWKGGADWQNITLHMKEITLSGDVVAQTDFDDISLSTWEIPSNAKFNNGKLITFWAGYDGEIQINHPYDYVGTEILGREILTTITHTSTSLNLENHALAHNLVLQGTADIYGYGNDLNNKITGNSGNNILKGGSGNDSLIGGGGSDKLYGDEGNDVMHGGSGNDLYYVDNTKDRVYETANAPSSSTTGAGGIDHIYSTVSFNLNTYNGVKFVEHLSLQGTANIYGYGNDLKNKITGNSGNNILKGGSGNDSLIGGDGSDKLYGGIGRDAMSGGSGNDAFLFTAINESSTSIKSCDIIRDFTHGVDKINLRAIDAYQSTSGTNDAFIWTTGVKFKISDKGEVRFKQFDNDGTTNDYTMIYIDTDADTGAEMVIRLTGLHNLTASDFIL